MAATLVFSANSFATERIDHFKGLPSPDLATAVKNFSEYNDLLAKQLAGELTPQALAEIHQLTYTLEVALEKIGDEIKALADTLEEVHIASETSAPEKLAEEGKKYMQVVNELKKL
ncbi:MAG: hypothetical protein GX665_09385 [Gammaproteobacteria bacterium]|nr:hypothetical protein [Gammaproteobacteria bacterium]